MSDLTSLQFIGDAECLIEYDYTPAEAPNYNVESRGVGPGCDASVVVNQVFVNGEWIDADNFAPSVLARLAQKILEEVVTEQADMREFYEEQRAELAREDRRAA